MWLQPHDMARFGWLYLNKGQWAGRQIVPADWVAASTRGHVAAVPFDHYGYQWWIDSGGYYMAVGYKGQRIFVVPEKNMVAVFTGELTGREALTAKKLLDFFIIRAASATDAMPADMQAHTRLIALINAAAQAPPSGYTWFAEDEGRAQDGVFKRTATPGFEFAYPAGSKKVIRDAPGQVMRMKTPSGVDFSASVVDTPEGLPLEDFGAGFYARQLAWVGSNIEIISNREITLNCGTRAFRTEISWLWQNSVPITTSLVTAYRDGQVIFVCAHPWKNHDEVEPIVGSITLN